MWNEELLAAPHGSPASMDLLCPWSSWKAATLRVSIPWTAASRVRALSCRGKPDAAARQTALSPRASPRPGGRPPAPLRRRASTLPARAHRHTKALPRAKVQQRLHCDGLDYQTPLPLACRWGRLRVARHHLGPRAASALPGVALLARAHPTLFVQHCQAAVNLEANRALADFANGHPTMTSPVDYKWVWVEQETPASGQASPGAPERRGRPTVDQGLFPRHLGLDLAPLALDGKLQQPFELAIFQ